MERTDFQLLLACVVVVVVVVVAHHHRGLEDQRTVRRNLPSQQVEDSHTKVPLTGETRMQVAPDRMQELVVAQHRAGWGYGSQQGLRVLLEEGSANRWMNGAVLKRIQDSVGNRKGVVEMHIEPAAHRSLVAWNCRKHSLVKAGHKPARKQEQEEEQSQPVSDLLDSSSQNQPWVLVVGVLEYPGYPTVLCLPNIADFPEVTQ